MRRPDWRRAGWVGACVLGAWLPVSGWLQTADWALQDRQMALLAAHREARPAGDIVIVALDESTLAMFPEPLALIHPHLGGFFEAAAQAGARAVAVDLVLPERSYEGIAPGYDVQLIGGIAAMRRAGPLVLARTVDAAGRPRKLHGPFAAVAGDNGLGYALLAVDGDGTVRRFDEKLGQGGAAVPTMIGQLARLLGAPVVHGTLDFTRRTEWPLLPLRQVLAWARGGDHERLVQALRGKVLLLGSTLALVDQHRVPVAADGRHGPMHGVFIHARALSDLRHGSLITGLPVVGVVLAGVLCAAAWGLRRRALVAAVLGAVAIAGLSAWGLTMGWSMPAASLIAVLLAAALARRTGEAIAELRQRRRLRQVFAGYVSPGVMAELEAGRLEGLCSERRFICVLFVDVRGFTERSETDSPEQVTTTLNQLFERATGVIHAQGGTVKEFMGDGVMAFFGAPAALADPVRTAFEAARGIFAALPEINASLARMSQAPLAIGMGMACGEAVVGHIGAARRHTYGAVGDCVNLASRLEGLSKSLGWPLVTSREVRAALAGEAGLVALGEQAIKGHSAVEVYGWKPPGA